MSFVPPPCPSEECAASGLIADTEDHIFCDVDPNGEIIAYVLVSRTYDSDGNPASPRFFDPFTSAPYVVQGELQQCCCDSEPVTGGGGSSRFLDCDTDSITVCQGTDPWVVTGTVEVLQGTDPWIVHLDETIAVSGTFTSNAEYPEDSPHISGDIGSFILVVRNDVSGSLVDADQDYAPLQVDERGNLRTVDDYDTFEAQHVSLVANTDTTITFAQVVRSVRVSNWDPSNRILIKDGAITSNSDATAARVGKAPTTDVPERAWFPFSTLTIHLRSASNSEVTIEGYRGSV